MDLNEYDLKK
jgi:hypothetical protein